VARDAESAAAIRAIEGATGEQASAGVLVLQEPRPTPATPAGRAQIAALDRELRSVPGVASVSSFATTGARALLSRDMRTALHAVTLHADADDATVVAAL
jgi:hypothetical protein